MDSDLAETIHEFPLRARNAEQFDLQSHQLQDGTIVNAKFKKQKLDGRHSWVVSFSHDATFTKVAPVQEVSNVKEFAYRGFVSI